MSFCVLCGDNTRPMLTANRQQLEIFSDNISDPRETVNCSFPAPLTFQNRFPKTKDFLRHKKLYLKTAFNFNIINISNQGYFTDTEVNESETYTSCNTKQQQ